MRTSQGGLRGTLILAVISALASPASASFVVLSGYGEVGAVAGRDSAWASQSGTEGELSVTARDVDEYERSRTVSTRLSWGHGPAPFPGWPGWHLSANLVPEWDSMIYDMLSEAHGSWTIQAGATASRYTVVNTGPGYRTPTLWIHDLTSHRVLDIVDGGDFPGEVTGVFLPGHTYRLDLLGHDMLDGIGLDFILSDSAPEPGVALLVCVGGALLGVSRRRRSNHRKRSGVSSTTCSADRCS